MEYIVGNPESQCVVRNNTVTVKSLCEVGYIMYNVWSQCFIWLALD